MRPPPRKPPRKAPPATSRRHSLSEGGFAALVLKWRTARQLSQPAAAALLGVPYRTFQDWEYGRRAPRGLALELITGKLNS
jgi:DNA-binding transcriptional regulator YiaG